MYGMWKGVKVIVKKTNGKISTIFPDASQTNKMKGNR